MQRKKIDLSIVIIAHREGELAGRTVENMVKMAKHLENVSYDFWVNIDRGDDKTRRILKKYEGENFHIFETDFGDPGLARNSIIKKADGEFVAVIDADDMVSENWLKLAIERLKKERNILVHPEAEIRYKKDGLISSILLRTESNNKEINRLFLFEGNRWCSIIAGRRKIFLEHPYSKTDDNFGYEDYYFNCETTEDGFLHAIIPETAGIILEKDKSQTTKTHEGKLILPKTRLFDLKKMRKIDEIDLEQIKIVWDGKLPAFVKKQMEIFTISFKNEMILGKDNIFIGSRIGMKFSEMLKEIKMPFGKVKIIPVENLVELEEAKKKGEKGIFVVTEAENVPIRKNVLRLATYFDDGYERETVKKRLKAFL